MCLAAERIHGDDTTVPVLAKSKTVTGRLWTYVRDDRPFGGPSPPAAIFYYSCDREGVHPSRHLASYAGILQADAYAGYNDLYKPAAKTGADHRGRVLEPWAPQVLRARRYRQGRRRRGHRRNTPPGRRWRIEAVRRIDLIFDAERDVNGLVADKRLDLRRTRVAPLVADLEAWMRDRARQALASQRRRQGDGLHAEALGRLHPLPRRRPHLPHQQCRRTGAARCRPRPQAGLFCGSDRGGERAAAIYTLIATAKLNDIDPEAWLADVLRRINDHPASKLDELLPWNCGRPPPTVPRLGRLTLPAISARLTPSPMSPRCSARMKIGLLDLSIDMYP